MVKENRVLIVGGGASGMMAAIAAATNGCTEVYLLEKMNRVGKKLLATGNGRCNLTNTNLDITRFHGKNPKFAFGVLGKIDSQQVISFFEYFGITHKVEDEGKVYPFSDQASSVLDVLRHELERLKVKVYCDAEVKEITPAKGVFNLALKNGEVFTGDKVILATGGKAMPNSGSNGSGYQLAKSLGHKLIEPFPALVKLKLKAPFLKQLKGVKFQGKATIKAEDKIIREESGEILFTDVGISGPPILQLSRRVGEQLQKKKKTTLDIDMFPHLHREELVKLISTRIGYQPSKSLEFSFVGLLNKRLIPVVLKEAGIENINKPCGELDGGEQKDIVNLLKGWSFEVTGTESWMQAQVTAGGIDVRQINPKTMESKLVPGLFFAGEILDIDGDCGGFNLQWAWSSGYVAGEEAAKP